MTKKIQELQAAAKSAVEQAKSIAEAAQAAAREMTPEEKSTFDEQMTKGRELFVQLQTAKKDQEVLDGAKALAAEIGSFAVDDVEAQGETGGFKAGKALGGIVIASEAFKSAIKAFGPRGVQTSDRFSTNPIDVKSLIVGSSPTSAGAFVVPEQSGIVEPLGRRPLTMRDLISVRPTGSDAIEYVVQTAHTNAATPVAEATTAAAPTASGTAGALIPAPGGGYYPESSWTYERETVNVKEIPVWVPVTKRALADVAQLEALLNDELAADLAEAEEAQILNGNGTGENLTGILQTPGLQVQTFVGSIFDSIRKGITKARVVGRVEPNSIQLSPGDCEVIDLARENGETGKYLGAGPFGSGQRTIWGIPYSEQEGLTDGEGLLGDFKKAVLWDRQQATVDFTDSHADFFVRGLVAARATERVALGVTRPAAFVKVATRA